jgi:hypothetical protein
MEALPWMDAFLVLIKTKCIEKEIKKNHAIGIMWYYLNKIFL